ncbi:MAG: glycosyltransferase family A protein [Anaerohalosphaeraceae bacterium]
MARQTVKPDQWIVVDDGHDPLAIDSTPECCQYIRRSPSLADPRHTMILNMQEAISRIRGDVVIIEDDEYYAPEYIETMADKLKSFELVGIGQSRYYHLPTGGYYIHRNMNHASLAQTAFRLSFLPHVASVLEGNQWLDIRIWSIVNGSQAIVSDAKPYEEKRVSGDGRGLIFNDYENPLYCGIKGLPGRKGIGIGHKENTYPAKDRAREMIKIWIPDDYQTYLDLLEVKP